MSGYLGWNNTGNEKVDALMGDIETAGDGFHNTSEWSEPLEYRDDGKSYLDLIQDSANSVAEQFNLLEAENDELKSLLEESKCPNAGVKPNGIACIAGTLKQLRGDEVVEIDTCPHCSRVREVLS